VFSRDPKLSAGRFGSSGPVLFGRVTRNGNSDSRRQQDWTGGLRGITVGRRKIAEISRILDSGPGEIMSRTALIDVNTKETPDCAA